MLTYLAHSLSILCVSPDGRFYGGHDLKPCIRIQEHIFKERDEREVGQRDELLCLFVDDVSCHSHTICSGRRRAAIVGCWLAQSPCRHRSTFCLVSGNHISSKELKSSFSPVYPCTPLTINSMERSLPFSSLIRPLLEKVEDAIRSVMGKFSWAWKN